MQVINRFKRPLAIAAALIALGPPIFLAIYLANHALDYPQWDTWKSAEIAISARQGSLTFQQLYDQPRAYTSSGEMMAVNGQRVFFTNAVTAALGRLFNWPIRGEAYISLILACGTYLLLADLFRRQVEGAWPIVLAPFSLLLFSLEDYYNLTWGFQNAYFFTGFFFAAGLWVADRRGAGWWAPAAAGALALASTFSTPVGFVCWPVFFAVQYAAGRRDRLFIGLWAAAALGAVALYAHDYIAVVSPDVSLWERLARLSIAADVVMRPLGLSGWYLIPAAAVLIASIVYLVRAQGQLRIALTWGGALAYTLAGGVMVSVLRTGWTMRYVTFAMPFWVGSVALTVAAAVMIGREAAQSPKLWALRAANLVFAGLVVIGVVAADINSYEPATSLPNDAYEACYLAYPITRDQTCISYLMPKPTLKGWLPAVETDRLLANRMSVFGDISPLPIEGYRDGDAVVVDSRNPLDHIWTAYTSQQKNAFHLLPRYPQMAETPPSQFATSTIMNKGKAGQARFEAYLDALPAGSSLWYVWPPDGDPDGRPFGTTYQALIEQACGPAGPPAAFTVRGRALVVTAYRCGG